jgi:hypothetical protein
MNAGYKKPLSYLLARQNLINFIHKKKNLFLTYQLVTGARHITLSGENKFFHPRDIH